MYININDHEHYMYIYIYIQSYMSSPLTFKSLSILNLADSSSGNYRQTPEGSEVDELESMSLLAEWLAWAQTNQFLTNKRHLELSCYLDTIPTVGGYVRLLAKGA